MATKLNILDLPVDILALIFQPLLTASSAISLCPCAASPVDPLALFLAHPAFHAIAAPLFYAANGFLLDLGGAHAGHVRHVVLTPPQFVLPPPRAMLLTTPDALRRLRALEVRVDRLRGWVHDVCVPLVADMVVRGALEHLVVRVRYSGLSDAGRRAGSNSDLALFARPPLLGLLRLLADPYLRTARLWVAARHPPAWCRFHRSDAGCDGLIAAGTGTDPDPELEVDWRDILREVDPEGRQVAGAWAQDPDVMRQL